MNRHFATKYALISTASLLLLAACASGGKALTMNSFYEVPIGATQPEVIATVGEPYSIQRKADGTVELEYIERIKEGARNLEERRYIITLKDGKVISKKVKQGSPPPYLFDSYQMQTTQSQEPKNDE